MPVEIEFRIENIINQYLETHTERELVALLQSIKARRIAREDGARVPSDA